jgi:hypothetical protein
MFSLETPAACVPAELSGQKVQPATKTFPAKSSSNHFDDISSSIKIWEN